MYYSKLFLVALLAVAASSHVADAAQLAASGTGVASPHAKRNSNGIMIAKRQGGVEEGVATLDDDEDIKDRAAEKFSPPLQSDRNGTNDEDVASADDVDTHEEGVATLDDDEDIKDRAAEKFSPPS
ncbi:hypothetical protein H4219_006024 [Mycoemilia scoparia]|uniref:RxLR effector protein n=1 Tax=Mycoemilia scoparia TaxID=417184 RepID=A0A9W7ZRY8_9FUNG|nr:hypothetical protein H4219_006024 [Mycoemilia scoparia]